MVWQTDITNLRINGKRFGYSVLLGILIFAGTLYSYSQESNVYKMDRVDDKLIAVSLSMSGQDEKTLVEQASLKAVMATIGRIYFEDRILLATDILTQYVSHQYKKFIISTKITQKRWVAGIPTFSITVYVDWNKVVNDLEEKRFVYQPLLKPYFDVYFEEKIEGTETFVPVGRTAIVEILRDEPNLRVAEVTEPSIPPTNIDVTISPTILRSATIAAQKKDVEMIVTGNGTTKLVKTEELYYTNYYFYKTSVHVKLIRVDTGEILKEAKAERMASSTNQQESVNLSVKLTLEAALIDILNYYRTNWQVMMGHQADNIFMFTGISQKKLESLLDMLNGIGVDAKAYLKNYWEGVAVVSLSYKRGGKDVARFLEANPFPVLHIVRQDGTRFEVQVE